MITKNHGRVSIGRTPDGTSLLQYGGDKLYVACNVDRFDPPRYLIRADSWEEAYEVATGLACLPEVTCEACWEEGGWCGQNTDGCGESVWWSEDAKRAVDTVALNVSAF